MLLEQCCSLRLTRPSLLEADRRVAESFFSFSGILSSNWDVVPAIVSDNRSGFVGNQDQGLFFFVARLFFVLAGNRQGCSILVWGFLGLQVEFDDKPCSGRVSWQRFPSTQRRV